MSLSRRSFLKFSSLVGLSGLLPYSLQSRADTIASSKLFVNLALDGGPDFRHLFVPPYSAVSGSYGNTFWKSRASAHGINDSNNLSALKARFENNYTPVTLSGNSFSVLNSCGWLIQQINAGNVAIVNNAVLSTNRDHPHSQLIAASAVSSSGAHDVERSGWGGRLAQQANVNITSLSQNVKLFCNGAKKGFPLLHSNERVFDMSDSRQSALQEFNLATAENANKPYRETWDDAILQRALRSYYLALENEITTTSPFYPVIENEINLRNFGQAISNRLAGYPVPENIKAFYDFENKSGNLSNPAFGNQIRNLYDAILSQDVLNMGVASLDYGGWDSHKRTNEIEMQFNDIFGLGKGFDVLYSQLEVVAPNILDQMVILVSGEFGRQLLANGTNGTDHGTGNSMLLIGNSVSGGSYGELFPKSELGGGNIEPEYTFSQPNADIKGRTSMQQVYGRVCEWLAPNTANSVVPGWKNSILEDSVDLSNILS